jgi:hypothetical protein
MFRPGQNMISAGTGVRRTTNLLLIAAEADAGHRCCNITARGPRNRLNYNDERLKLLYHFDHRFTHQENQKKTYLPLLTYCLSALDQVH